MSNRPETPAQRVPSWAWLSAFGAFVAMVLTIPLGIGFFLFEGVFALLSDLGGLVVGILLVPLVVTVRRLHEDSRSSASLFVLGVVTVAGICVGSLGLVVLHLLPVETATVGGPFLGVQFIGWLLLGFWLLGVGLLDRSSERWSSLPALAAGVGAVGGIVTLVYSYAVGSFTLAFPAFMALFAVGFLLWTLSFGLELRAIEREHVSSGNAESAPVR